MPRTPEQVAADEHLNDAIDQAYRAYFPEAEHGGRGVPMEYAVVGCAAIIDEDGDPFTRVFQLTRDDGVPIHRLLGLLDYSATRLRAQVVE